MRATILAAGVDRIPVEIAATLSSLAEDAPGPMPATIVDLSEAGATLLVASARPQASERYLLEFRSFDGAVSQQLAARTTTFALTVTSARVFLSM